MPRNSKSTPTRTSKINVRFEEMELNVLEMYTTDGYRNNATFAFFGSGVYGWRLGLDCTGTHGGTGVLVLERETS